MRAKREATVIDLSKETTVQRERRLALLEGLRRVLVKSLKSPFGELPATVQSAIQACEDADKLEEAIARVRGMASLDEFQL
jgi:hypothetical protein